MKNKVYKGEFINKKMQRVLTMQRDIPKIAKEISSIKSVDAIILFGSMAGGRASPLSDIDLCVIGNLTKKERERVLLQSSDNLDITFFSQLPPGIQFRVLKEGKYLVNKNPEKTRELQKKVAKRYIDFKHILNTYQKRLLHVR
jgi:predicted nucleotidyltransferase